MKHTPISHMSSRGRPACVTVICLACPPGHQECGVVKLQTKGRGGENYWTMREVFAAHEHVDESVAP